MGFTDALVFFLDLRKTTVTTRLNHFFERSKKIMTEQAFSKLRAKYDHTPFMTMHHTLVESEYDGKHECKMWNNYHVFAIDGSYLQLPTNPETIAEFGVRGAGAHASAGISVMYDVLSGWPVHAVITRSNMNERKVAEEHFDYLKEKLPLLLDNTVMLFDRGYPSLEMTKLMPTKLVMRSQPNWLKEVGKLPQGDSQVRLRNGVTVRVYKFKLPSGAEETLITNMFDVSAEQLAELYGMRWAVETAYNVLKNELCVEDFSGRTPNAIRQDFWASMVLMICVSVFKAEADEELKSKRAASKQGTPNKYQYQVRQSDLIVTLRDRFVFNVLRQNRVLAALSIQRLIPVLARSTSPIREADRHFPRHVDSLSSFNPSLKSHL
jgi:hypothetical protein